MTYSNSFKTLDKSRLQVLVLSKSEIDKEDFDHEQDLKDYILEKARVIKKYREIYSEWSLDGQYYVLLIKT